MDLSNLHPAKGSKKTRKRVGRGPGSGLGKTSGRGHKGQKARSGARIKRGFEGGQMPLYVRLPKRGFRNIFSQEYQIVNVGQLARCPAGEEITPETLKKNGLIKNLQIPVKLLGNGAVETAFTVKVSACSKSAREKIENAGGKVEVA